MWQDRAMPKKKTPKPKARKAKKKTIRREDVNQAAARIVREATNNH
jgi:histone H3/H4